MRYASGLFVTLFVYLLTNPLIVNGYPNKQSPLPDDVLSDGAEREEIAKNHPKIITKSSTKAANEGETVTFPCEVDDLGSLSIAWTKRRGPTSASLFLGSFRVVADDRLNLQGSSLTIKNVTQADSGTYICKVSTDKDISIEHILYVHGRPSIEKEPSKNPVTLNKGQTLQLKCKSTAEPKPDIKWEKDNAKLTPNLYNQDTLVIANVDRKDAGKYRCEAYSFAGSSNMAEFDVIVEEGPEIELPEPAVYTGLDQEVRIRCKVYGNPSPTVYWENYRGSRLVGTPVSGSNENILTLKIRDESDFGKYRCTGTNKFGKDYKEIEVSGRPSKPAILNSDEEFPTSGDQFELKYQVTSYSPITKIIVTYRYSKDTENFSDWNTTEIGSTDSNGPTYNLRYILQNMDRNTYEVKVYAENKYGRSEGSDVYSITADGEKEQHWKVAGSSSYRVKSSANISIITCLVLLFTFCLAS